MLAQWTSVTPQKKLGKNIWSEGCEKELYFA